MQSWWDSVLAFSAQAKVGHLLASTEPAWVWSGDGSRILWANPAGGAYLGTTAFPALAARSWHQMHPLRRAIQTIGRSAPQGGAPARLRLAGGPAALPLACRCSRVRTEGLRGLLIVGPTGAASPSLEAIAAFFSDQQVGALIVGESGQVLAGDAEPGETSSLGSASFTAAGRVLQISWTRRDLVGTAAPPSEGDRPQGSLPPFVESAPDTPKTAAAMASDSDSGAVQQAHVAAPRNVPDPGVVPADLAGLRAALLEAVAEQLASARPLGRDKAVKHSGIVERRTQSREEPPALASYDGPALTRPIVAGRMPRELPRKPVRFLWQTDNADRFLFVSPGLSQVVGRNAEIVGERWQEAASRLQLDPARRIERALAQRDTWSGQTAWWPVEGSNVRVPAELTALPIFGADHSFQGFRGFGVLKPAEALMPATFESRFGAALKDGGAPAEQIPPDEESVAGVANVVPIRADLERQSDHVRLTAQERSAFDEIAASLRNRVAETRRSDDPPAPAEPAKGAVAGSDASASSIVPLRASARADAKAPDATIAPGAGIEAASSVPEASGDDAPARERAPAEPPALPVPGLTAEHVEPGRPEPHSLTQQIPGAPSVRAVADSDAQRLLREMTAVLDTATDGVIVLEADGTIESVNASAEALFGLDGDELRGTRFTELLTPESRTAALDYLAGLVDNGVASLLNEGREIEAQIGPGRIPLFMTMGRISGDGEGRFCAVLRDITHWKRTEAELVAARRAAEDASHQKSEFLARVSHEIRTPLNAIIGFAEVMIEERFGPVGNDRYREYLRDIRTSGEHVVSLVNDLLDISKIEAGKLDLTFAAVPLNDLVRECIGLMQPQANRAHVVLRSSVSRDVPAIVADQRTMRQIVLNLLSNSVKFTGPGGQVIASTSLAESGEALLRIRDTGEGMSEDELARALEPFRQIATTTLADRTGTGLGLPLTKALVEANRASLAIRSARGEGTVVTITFPATRVLSE